MPREFRAKDRVRIKDVPAITGTVKSLNPSGSSAVYVIWDNGRCGMALAWLIELVPDEEEGASANDARKKGATDAR